MRKVVTIFSLFICHCAFSYAQHKVLYGLTTQGGTYNYGTLFSYDLLTGKDTALFSFNGTNGSLSEGDLLETKKGILYGTTETGGSKNDGVFFSYDPKSDKEATVFEFSGVNGMFPAGKLSQDSSGLIYSTTGFGGEYGSGVIFSYDPMTNKDSTLFSFNDTNGLVDYGGLTLVSNGFFYGMTTEGGKYNKGVIFSFDSKSNKDSILFTFDGSNGALTQNYLIKAKNGIFYGLTGEGGTKNYGVLFSFDPKINSETVLVNFDSLNGSSPLSSLLQATNGLLYGMAETGGINNGGVLFSYNITTGKDSILINFNNLDNGSFAFNNLIEDSTDGLLYGTVRSGGIFNDGYIFSYNINTGRDSVLLNFNGSNGAKPVGTLLLVKDTLTGINELQGKNEEIKVFPNPSKGVFTIESSVVSAGPENSAGKSSVEIYNELGQEVFSTPLNLPQGRDFKIDLSSQSAGIYLYRVVSEKGNLIASGKLVIE